MLPVNWVDRGCNSISHESGQTFNWSFITRQFDKPNEKATQMMVDNNTGAAFNKSRGWSSIGHEQAERNVHRLQTRIVKAVQANRWGKVKSLQRLLTCSLSGKILAVKRVTENQGSKTPGVDGVI